MSDEGTEPANNEPTPEAQPDSVEPPQAAAEDDAPAELPNPPNEESSTQEPNPEDTKVEESAPPTEEHVSLPEEQAPPTDEQTPAPPSEEHAPPIEEQTFPTEEQLPSIEEQEPQTEENVTLTKEQSPTSEEQISMEPPETTDIAKTESQVLKETKTGSKPDLPENVSKVSIAKEASVSKKKSSHFNVEEHTSTLGIKPSTHSKIDAISSENLRKTDKGLKPVESKEYRRLSRLGSRAQKILGSTISIRRLSVIGDADRLKGARFMNTYKLDSDNPFNPDKVQKILESVMLEAFENLTYDPEKCPKQAKWASSTIRAKIKELQFDRYKLICLVTIGEKTSQDVLVTCRFLWDADRDRYAFYSLENTYVYGVAMCFGLYYE